MLKKLGRSITIANAAAFLVVILVGGVSIYLTKDILKNAYKIEELSEDIITIDEIHSSAYRLVLSMHHFLIEPDALYSEESINTIAELVSAVQDYRAAELEEQEAEVNLEIKHLDIMLEDVKGLGIIRDLFEQYAATGKYDRDKFIDLEEFAYELEDTADTINRIHRNKIKDLISESLYNMWVILCIYLVFITIGGVAIYGGHKMLLKKVVNPVKSLAQATAEIANGTLDKRVHIDSETEVGQLYRSFNDMAEKLQENDGILRKFNEELEKKVRERTRELQFINEQLKKTQMDLIRTEKIAAIGQIAAGVTHEIKNPLNSLSINAQMLLKELADKFGSDSSLYEAASLIRHEIGRINNILEEFVKFAKFPEPRFFRNSINEVVTEVFDLISSRARDKEMTVKLSLQDVIPPFSFDSQQIKEVLINLSENSFKAMQAGGELEIKTRTQDENVIITVTDSGEGIPEKNMEKIFTPFFSTKEGGLGLGLPIAQRIIESHNGTIQCVNNYGSGATFEIVLPVKTG